MKNLKFRKLKITPFKRKEQRKYEMEAFSIVKDENS